jgi:hypothetical protein
VIERRVGASESRVLLALRGTVVDLGPDDDARFAAGARLVGLLTMLLLLGWRARLAAVSRILQLLDAGRPVAKHQNRKDST